FQKYQSLILMSLLWAGVAHAQGPLPASRYIFVMSSDFSRIEYQEFPSQIPAHRESDVFNTIATGLAEKIGVHFSRSETASNGFAGVFILQENGEVHAYFRKADKYTPPNLFDKGDEIEALLQRIPFNRAPSKFRIFKEFMASYAWEGMARIHYYTSASGEY